MVKFFFRAKFSFRVCVCVCVCVCVIFMCVCTHSFRGDCPSPSRESLRPQSAGDPLVPLWVAGNLGTGQTAREIPKPLSFS